MGGPPANPPGFKRMELGAYETDILDSVENGEWRSVSNLDEQRNALRATAGATFRKDHQTLIAGVLHKYVSGRLHP